MIISRVEAGLFTIGGSIFLFGADVFLTDETAMQITMLEPVQNLFFFVYCPADRRDLFHSIEQSLSCMWRKGLPRQSRLQILRMDF